MLSYPVELMASTQMDTSVGAVGGFPTSVTDATSVTAVEDLYSMEDLLPVPPSTSSASVDAIASTLTKTPMGITQMDVTMSGASLPLPTSATKIVGLVQLTDPIRQELIQMDSRFIFDSNIELSPDQQSFLIRCSLSEYFLKNVFELNAKPYFQGANMYHRCELSFQGTTRI